MIQNLLTNLKTNNEKIDGIFIFYYERLKSIHKAQSYPASADTPTPFYLASSDTPIPFYLASAPTHPVIIDNYNNPRCRRKTLDFNLG